MRTCETDAEGVRFLRIIIRQLLQKFRLVLETIRLGLRIFYGRIVYRPAACVFRPTSSNSRMWPLSSRRVRKKERLGSQALKGMRGFIIVVSAAVYVHAVSALECPALPALSTSCDDTSYAPGATQDIHFRSIVDRWPSYGAGDKVKPVGYQEDIEDSTNRFAKLEVVAFGNCSDHMMVMRQTGAGANANQPGGWCDSYNDCLVVGTQKHYDWGGTRKGFYGRYPTIAPAPSDGTGYGQCLVSSSDMGSTSTYKLVDYGAMVLTFSEPSTLEFNVTLGDMDGRNNNAKEGGSIFGVNSTGGLVEATLTLGSNVAQETADIVVADGEALGLDTGGANMQIQFVEPVSTAGSSQTDTNHHVLFTFKAPISKLVFLFTWAMGPVDHMKSSNAGSGYAIWFDESRGPEVGCAVKCSKTYDPSDVDGVCDPGQSLFDITYDPSSTRYCQEVNYCNTCNGENEIKLSNHISPGQFYAGTGPPKPPL